MTLGYRGPRADRVDPVVEAELNQLPKMRVTDLPIRYRGLLRAEPQRRSARIFSGGASRIGFRSAHMVGFWPKHRRLLDQLVRASRGARSRRAAYRSNSTMVQPSSPIIEVQRPSMLLHDDQIISSQRTRASSEALARHSSSECLAFWLASGRYTSIGKPAGAVKPYPSVVRQELRLALLAPSIASARLNGTQPAHSTLRAIPKRPFWVGQRKSAFGPWSSSVGPREIFVNLASQ